MTIHLAGEAINAKGAHQRPQVGELVQLVQAMYVEQDVDADAAI